MITVKAPVEEVIAELELLIKGLREGTVRCASIHKMNTIERVGVTQSGDYAYIKVATVDVSFTGEIK